MARVEPDCRAAIVVRSEPDVVRADKTNDVSDRFRDVLWSGAADGPIPVADSHDATVLGDPAHMRIGEVPLVVTGAANAAVGEYDGSRS